MTPRSTRARARHLQRHRHRRSIGPSPRPTRSNASGSIRAGRSCCSSGASRARKASSIWRAPFPTLDPDAQVVLCAGAPDTPEIAAEMEQAVAEAQREHGRRDLDPRDAAARRRSCSATATRRCSAARRSTSRSGSSIWRRWPAARRSSPAPSAASRRSWSTARRACWCRSNSRPRVRSSRATQRDSARTWPMRSTACWRDRGLRARMARAGRERVEREFAWPAIAAQTADLYATPQLSAETGVARTPAPARSALFDRRDRLIAVDAAQDASLARSARRPAACRADRPVTRLLDDFALVVRALVQLAATRIARAGSRGRVEDLVVAALAVAAHPPSSEAIDQHVSRHVDVDRRTDGARPLGQPRFEGVGLRASCAETRRAARHAWRAARRLSALRCPRRKPSKHRLAERGGSSEGSSTSTCPMEETGRTPRRPADVPRECQTCLPQGLQSANGVSASVPPVAASCTSARTTSAKSSPTVSTSTCATRSRSIERYERAGRAVAGRR